MTKTNIIETIKTLNAGKSYATKAQIEDAMDMGEIQIATVEMLGEGISVYYDGTVAHYTIDGEEIVVDMADLFIDYKAVAKQLMSQAVFGYLRVADRTIYRGSARNDMFMFSVEGGDVQLSNKTPDGFCGDVVFTCHASELM